MTSAKAINRHLAIPGYVDHLRVKADFSAHEPLASQKASATSLA
jgi:hypothetical protein